MLARDWMVANIPAGSKIVVEPIAPDQWATDAGHPLFEDRRTGSGNRWNKWRTSRSCFFNGRHDRRRRLPAWSSSRTTSAPRGPSWSAPTSAAASAGSSPARPSTAARTRTRRPSRTRCRYYGELQEARGGRLPRRARTAGAEPCRSPSTTRSTTTRSTYDRPGPEIVIYQLRWRRHARHEATGRSRRSSAGPARRRRAEPDRVARRAHARDDGRARRSRTPRPRSCSARRSCPTARRASCSPTASTAAAELYKAGRVNKLLLSGDHRRLDYDEVGTMRRILLAQGIPAQDIFTDHAGFDTWDSRAARAARLRRLQRRRRDPELPHGARALRRPPRRPEGHRLRRRPARLRPVMRRLRGPRGRRARQDLGDVVTGADPHFLGARDPDHRRRPGRGGIDLAESISSVGT